MSSRKARKHYFWRKFNLLGVLHRGTDGGQRDWSYLSRQPTRAAQSSELLCPYLLCSWPTEAQFSHTPISQIRLTAIARTSSQTCPHHLRVGPEFGRHMEISTGSESRVRVS
ncbi:hypothetical protein RRG08_062698 [Elysia crispata]|uniref:Uncharacterized protein n=1 Tax=Elysia crispata TaxID=231223 RepID=A0AAE1AC81_9GAST|nr:hypothetical protein RRG08_062698 [Elysia crispata]